MHHVIRVKAKRAIGFYIISVFIICSMYAQDQLRWKHSEEGGIVWNVKAEENLPHSDNIEMDGLGVPSLSLQILRVLALLGSERVGSAGSARVR